MSDFGLGKILDSIGGALHIFDFSFFVSGLVTVTIVAADIVSRIGCGSLSTATEIPGWMLVLTVLIAIYVSGLISWMFGRKVRELLLADFRSIEDVKSSLSAKDFEKTYDALVDSLGIERHKDLPKFKRKMDIYSYMWIKLDSLGDDNVRRRLVYCNRMWVMRALFEGLSFSWLLAILVLIDYTVFQRQMVTVGLPTFIFLIAVFFALMWQSAKTATSYANDQVKEIVVAYQVYILKNEE